MEGFCMKTFLNERRRSAGYARDRMKLLLISTDDENVKKRSGTYSKEVCDHRGN
jgi:septum formation topological specificity factor MinE